MKSKDIDICDVVRLRKNEDIRNIIDVDLDITDSIKSFNSLSCNVVFYPYSRKVDSNNITFNPFEEYVTDILAEQESAYKRIPREFNKIFGICLGLLIAMIFAIFKPEDLLSVQSVVSIIGAYIVSKELWDDIERLLIGISRNSFIKFMEPVYRYVLQKHSTLTHYSYLAKRIRYSKEHLLPRYINFIQQSNSQTLRMLFEQQDLLDKQGLCHIFSIHIDENILSFLKERGFMFGLKISLTRRFLCIRKNHEFFQSLEGEKKGCLDSRGGWVAGSVFYRNTLRIGRMKCFYRYGIIKNLSIIENRY